MYRVIYKGMNGGWAMSDKFDDIELAREYKLGLISAHYDEDKVYIITIIE